MDNKELTRENINYELTGLGMQLRYLRDALMCSFMDIPINYFFELRGNLPVAMYERMPFLERMVAAVDVEFFKDAKAQIFNTNDMELALKFCELDLVVWQLTMLASRYEEEHQALAYIAKKAGQLLKLVHFLKTEMLHKDFFCFNGIEEIQMTDLLEKVARERAQSGSAHGEYAGWSQLEDAVKACDDKSNADVFIDFANHGKFEVQSALEPEKVKELYLLLGEYRTATGPKNDMGVIDMSKISLSQFENALWHGCYTGFEDGGRNNKLRLVIAHLQCTEWKINNAMKCFEPNCYVEIGKEGVDAKIKALSMYRGVMRPYPHPRSAEYITGLAAVRGGQWGVNYAEAFEVVQREY